jgi:hypothetical protein
MGSEDLFNFQTFVSPDDADRLLVREVSNIRDIPDLYHMNNEINKDYSRDLTGIGVEFNRPDEHFYRDPDILILDSERYKDLIDVSVISSERDIVNSVIALYLLNTNPTHLHLSNRKYAIKYSDIDSRLAHDIKDRARGCSVRLKRSMPKNNRYTFSVTSRGGSGTHVVALRAEASDKRVKKLDKADLFLSCSCNYWIYYGPEYHARRGGYLDGKSKGTATPPRVRDPDGNHIVCKHVYAVLDYAKNYEYRW